MREQEAVLDEYEHLVSGDVLEKACLDHLKRYASGESEEPVFFEWTDSDGWRIAEKICSKAFPEYVPSEDIQEPGHFRGEKVCAGIGDEIFLRQNNGGMGAQTYYRFYSVVDHRFLHFH